MNSSLSLKSPLSADALAQLFTHARTFNHYTDTPVSEDTLRAVYDLAKMGATSANCQPMRIVWCTSDDAKEQLAGLAMDSNAEKIRKAPVTAIIGMDMTFYEHLPQMFPHTDAKSWFVGNDALIATTAMRNSSLQGAYLMLAARAMGLDCGPMSGFANDAVDAAFFAGTAVKSNFICTMGYGDPADLYPRNDRLSFEQATHIA